MSIIAAKKFMNALPETVEYMNFNIDSISDPISHKLLSAASSDQVSFVCCCSSGVLDDWLVSSKIIYKLPLLWDNELSLHMETFARLNIPMEVFQQIVAHFSDEFSVVLDLGSTQVRLNIEDNSISARDTYDNWARTINIPDSPVVPFTSNYFHLNTLMKEPHTLTFDKYVVQVGPRQLVRILHADNELYSNGL